MQPKSKRRETLTTLSELAGAGLVVVGVWLVFPPLAIILAGGGLIAIGFALDSKPGR